METILIKKENTLGATLLVTGCCIGAGMLGLPVVSAMAGFIPTTLAMLLCYLFATGSGLLLLEATLWFDQKVNLLSIAHFALGNAGKFVTCLLYLFLYYCLFVAYIDGGAQLFANTLTAFLPIPVSREIGIAICVLTIGGITYAGTRASDLANRSLMLGLVVLYIILISYGLPQVNADNMIYSDWSASLAAVPIILVCFGYQNLVPSLAHYLKRNVQMIRFAIMLGNLIPFAIYSLWNFVIIGLLPEAHSEAFETILRQNEMVTGLLESASSSPSVILFIKAFAFLAIFTSVLPNAISFIDFLSDGLKPLPLAGPSKHLIILALFLIPPALFSLFIPHLFLKALGMAGGFADVLLLGILPAVVVWIGRYVKKIKSSYTVAGGKMLILFVFAFSLFFLLLRNS